MTELTMETLTCRIESGIARVTLTQAERGNPFDGPFCRDMCDLSVELSCRDDVRAVLLTAEGRFFSVGGDIRSFLKDLSQLPRVVKSWTADVHMAITRFQRMNAPVVCAVHGDVAGGAVSLAAMSDILIAAEGVKFNAAFSMIGFCADSGSTVSLTNRMGFSRAKRFLMLSEVLEAKDALATGLVDFVVQGAELTATADAMAAKLAAGPTLAYGAIKRTILSARSEPLEAQLEHEAQALAQLASTEDAREGLTAFSQRRKPEFKGR
ncbi:enoyl-CoA hydratase/isomerase family protein [Mesorhizobium australicum]|uniref:2-(1,2-epoxy-1,2-dihydrophenyl)acetyl-CoA isomerase n=1 Tax=Mesorhizobium australicum TaxID=536018 RepID=A0A1X7PRR6_9HYPH|nr:enoyl-CoA hydratase/isomerase family protein [Mesorhizobium australicum]SMH54587.1 2-(1,2-epoxy-1,2-dihydrophenyl)acetyl-CoA isomerase [Mesorhizobium australicum]